MSCDHPNRYITTYTKDYRWADDSGGGFSFLCTSSGGIDRASLPIPAQVNLVKCIAGLHARTIVDAGVTEHRVDTCYPLYDARGVYVARVCYECEAATRAKYRPEIFTDPNYDLMGDTLEEDRW